MRISSLQLRFQLWLCVSSLLLLLVGCSDNSVDTQVSESILEPKFFGSGQVDGSYLPPQDSLPYADGIMEGYLEDNDLAI